MCERGVTVSCEAIRKSFLERGGLFRLGAKMDALGEPLCRSCHTGKSRNMTRLFFVSALSVRGVWCYADR